MRQRLKAAHESIARIMIFAAQRLDILHNVFCGLSQVLVPEALQSSQPDLERCWHVPKLERFATTQIGVRDILGLEVVRVPCRPAVCRACVEEPSVELHRGG